jgi:endogenous inhibitor of DNA gyrase (YacG/DUF329 family)
MAMSEPPVPRAQACPICGKISAPEFRPFCSRRCADVDLHRWFSGTSSAPAVEQDDEDSDAGQSPSRDRGDPD